MPIVPPYGNDGSAGSLVAAVHQQTLTVLEVQGWGPNQVLDAIDDVLAALVWDTAGFRHLMRLIEELS